MKEGDDNQEDKEIDQVGALPELPIELWEYILHYLEKRGSYQC